MVNNLAQDMHFALEMEVPLALSYQNDTVKVNEVDSREMFSNDILIEFN